MAIFAGKKKRVGTAWKRTYDRIPSTPYWPGLDTAPQNAGDHHSGENAIQADDSTPHEGDQTAQISASSQNKQSKPAFRRRHKKAESSLSKEEADKASGEATVNPPPSPLPAPVNNPAQVTPSAPNLDEKSDTMEPPAPVPVPNMANGSDPVRGEMLSKWSQCFPSADPKLIQDSVQQLSQVSVALAPLQQLLSQLPCQENVERIGLVQTQKSESSSVLQRIHSALDEREDYLQKIHADHTTLLQQQLEQVRQDKERKEEALSDALDAIRTLEEAHQIKAAEWTDRLRQLEEELDLKSSQIEQVQQDREQFTMSSIQRLEEGLHEIERLRKKNSELVADLRRSENENNRMRKMLSKTIGPSEHPSEPLSPGDRPRKRPRYMLKYASPLGSPSEPAENNVGSPVSASSSVSSARAVSTRPPAQRIIPGNSLKEPVHSTKSSLREVVPSFSQLASVDSLHRAGHRRD